MDNVTMQYEDVVSLVDHLRMLGESNAVLRRRRTLSYVPV